MTRYNDDTDNGWDAPLFREYGYREGVDRVIEYIEGIDQYRILVNELRWAISEGII